MFLRKIGEIAPVDQLNDVPIRAVAPGRDEFLLVPGLVVTMMVVVILVMMLILMAVVIPMIVFVLVIMILVIPVMFGFRVDVDRAGVYPEFDPLDPFALLALEMQVMVFECNLAQLPFEYRWRDSEIGQSTDKHIATDPGKAVQVENPHWSQ
jgi:hypothetical protein